MANERPIVFAVREVPIEAFGNEHGRQTRKFVLLVIATHADADGGKCFPGVGTIARECGLTQRGARKVIKWLHENGWLEIAYKASRLQTNVFTVTIPQVRNSSVPQELQRSSGTESAQVRNSSVPQGEERRARGAELQRSSNLPIDLPIPTKKKPTKARNSAALSFAVPEWIPSREWNDYLEMRRQAKKPMTDRAKELAVKKLAELREGGDAPADVLNQSVMNSWQGLFPLKRSGAGKRTASRHSGFDAIDYTAGLIPKGNGAYGF